VSRPATAAKALVVLLASASARGAPAPPEVAVLRPPGADRVLVEASTRLLQELGASGLTSALVDAAGDAPTHVAFGRDGDLPTIDVLATQPDGTALERRIRVQPDEGGGDPSVLAVRAVELLRALRLEVHPAAAVAPTPPALASAEPDGVEAPQAEPRAWRLAVGPSALEARPYGAALAFAPALAVSMTFLRNISIVGLGAGPFFTDRPATPVGSAHTREELALVGFRLETRRPRVNVHATFTAGMHHLRAEYDARGLPTNPPPPIHLVTLQAPWTPIVAVGAGAGGRIWRRLGVAVEVTALIAQPSLELIANGRSLGVIGGPSLMQTLWAWVEFP
jgi:hypothetical protein